MSNEFSHNVKPANGYVPDELTAVKIAEAILTPIYGDIVLNRRPFTAVLKEDIWNVEGSLPPGAVGGIPEIEISKDSGAILRVTHSK